jgi:hypothetical protein
MSGYSFEQQTIDAAPLVILQALVNSSGNVELN